MDTETPTGFDPNVQPTTILDQLTRTLEDAGIYVVATLKGHTLSLSGEVESIASRDAALDVARALAEPRGVTVEDDLDVVETSPESAFNDELGDSAGEFGYLDPDRDDDARLDPGYGGEPDFTGDVGTTDSEEAAAEAVPYFPPTDPVVAPSDDEEQLRVVGGFEGTSMDGEQGEAGFDSRNDDDVARDVLRELRQDALTTDLVVRVDVQDGVVWLRGEVETIDDAENAESVASRVGGVREVREELVVRSLRTE